MISATPVPCHGRRFSWLLWACLGLVTLVVGTPSAEAQPYVYVLSQESGGFQSYLTVINGATNQKGPRIQLGTGSGSGSAHPMAIAPDGQHIYVANAHDVTVSIVSTATNTVIATLPRSLFLPPQKTSTFISGVAVSPDSRRLYVAGESLHVIDTVARTRVNTVSGVQGSVAVSPDGSRVYARPWFVGSPGRVDVYDATALETVATHAQALLASVKFPHRSSYEHGTAITVSPNGRFVYIPRGHPDVYGTPAYESGTLAVVDTTTYTFTETPTYGTDAVFAAAAPNGSTVYVVGIGTQDHFHRLDPTTHASVGTAFMPSSHSVAFTADSARAYVASIHGVYVLDVARHAKIAEIPFDWGTDGIPYSVVVAGALPPSTSPSAPAAPTLTATVSGTTAHLAWAPSAGPSALSYVLEAGTAPSLSNAFNNNVGNATQLSAAAPPGTYYVRVRGVNASGLGAPSNELTLTIGGTPAASPGQPTITSAVASGGTLNVAWSPGVGSPATSHRLDFYSGGSLVASVNTGAPTSVAIPIPAGTQGTFEVRVTAANGAVAGPASLPMTFTIGAGCSPPARPTLSGGVVNGTASVNWAAVAGATSYVLSAGTTPGGTQYMPPTNLGANTGASASGLPASFSAWVRVFAVNACGQQSAAADFLVQ